MKTWACLLLLFLVSCSHSLTIEERPEEFKFTASQTRSSMGGQPVISLTQIVNGGRTASNLLFSMATVLPGRGMNVFDLRAHLPGKAEVSVFETAPIEALEVTESKGAAILLNDQILSGKMDRVEVASGSDHAAVTGLVEQQGVLLAVTTALKKRSFSMTLIAKNVGKEPLPIRLGWNPHFSPSAKLKSASDDVAEVVSGDGSFGVRIRSFSPESPGFEISRPGKSKKQPLNPRIGIKPVTLKPGESVTYSAEIELFKP